jgi:3-deoxy-D-manno-octulosonate 8-phosphate phosphatase (KDO 8-P phosphatase)
MRRLQSDELEKKIEPIKLVLMDCDGVLTDGRITLLPEGDEQKTFHTRDGHGIVLLHRAGIRTGIISGRKSSLVERRALELGMTYLRQGTWDKIKDFDEILCEANIEAFEVAYIGDDVTDIPLMERAGFAVAVADAVEETKDAAHYVTKLAGGFGAVREVADLILQRQDHWVELMKRYVTLGMEELEFNRSVRLAYKNQREESERNKD